eukprot:COSAG02_NODE_493_length_21166_cov_13.181318_17_plen_82_part_00
MCKSELVATDPRSIRIFISANVTSSIPSAAFSAPAHARAGRARARSRCGCLRARGPTDETARGTSHEQGKAVFPVAAKFGK